MAASGSGSKDAPKGDEAERKATAVAYGQASSIAWEFAGAILLCTLAGLWLDRRLGLSPWLTVAGALLGFGAGFTALVVRLGLLGKPRGSGSVQADPDDRGDGSDGGTKGDGA